MTIQHITKDNFQTEVLNSEQTVLLDFWAPWCVPCRMLAPVLEEVAAERPDVKVCKVNIDEEYDLAVRYRIASIPTLLVMDGGQVEEKLVGARPKDEILELLG